ncbi:MAG: HEAT repeat domain-containing protein [Cyanobacteria bacterium P01_F01_bin.53]
MEAIALLCQRITATKGGDKAIAAFLGLTLSDKAVPFLEKIARSPEKWVRVKVAKSLEKIASESAIRILMMLVEDAHHVVRAAAIDCLGSIRAAQAIGQLSEKLKDSNSSVRFSVVGALSSIGGVRVIEPLIEAFNDPNSEVREQAGYAIGAFPDLDTLSSVVFGKLTSALVQEVGKIEGDHYSYACEASIKALNRLDPAVIETLLPKITDILKNHPNEIAKVDILKLIACANSDSALELFEETLANTEDAYAYQLLLNNHIRYLQEKSSHYTKAQTLTAASKGDAEHVGDHETEAEDIETEKLDFALYIDKLREQAKHSDKAIRLRAIWLLGGFQDRKSVETLFKTESQGDSNRFIQTATRILITCLEDIEREVSIQAAVWLGRIGSPLALSKLKQLRIQKLEDEYFEAVQAIQNHCGYYSLPEAENREALLLNCQDSVAKSE